MLKHSSAAPLVKHLLAAVEQFLYRKWDRIRTENLGSGFPHQTCNLVLSLVQYRQGMSNENYNKWGVGGISNLADLGITVQFLLSRKI